LPNRNNVAEPMMGRTDAAHGADRTMADEARRPMKEGET
jgi:hypothetical protein